MAVEFSKDFWAEDPVSRLSIRKADQKTKSLIVNRLSSSSPHKSQWPYGMPTSVNPWLVMLGVSPGRAKNGSEEDLHSKRLEYVPSVGTAHQHFNSEPNWKKHTEWKGYWPKIRKLCVGLLEEKVGDNEDAILSICGHLNLGETRTGQGNADATDLKIIKWVPKVIAEQLRPQILLLFGLKGLLKSDRLKSWEDSGLGFIRPEHLKEVPFKDSSVSTKRFFQVWNNPVVGAYPRRVILLPNHPSRPPMSDPKKWASMIKQLKRIVFAA